MSAGQPIFIGYRRDDGGHAGRVYDHLAREFSRAAVFYDWESLPPARPYRVELEKAIRAARVFLAVIGQHWLSAQNRARLHEPDDVARAEIRVALERVAQPPYTLLPLLAGGAAMPRRADLPDDIAALAELQAHRLEDRHYDQSMRELVDFLADECGLGRMLDAAESNVVVGLRGAAPGAVPADATRRAALGAALLRALTAAAGQTP